MKKNYVLLFNAQTGAFIGEVEDNELFDSSSLGENIKYKKISLKDGEFWYGDYDDGAIYNNTEKRIVCQVALRDKTLNTILQKYEIFDQLNIIRKQLEKISGKNCTNEFKEMNDFIKETIEVYKAEKEAYSSDDGVFIWESDEHFAEGYEKRITGLL